MFGQSFYADDELLSLSGLQHLAYCERQWSLIHVERLWADSADTIRGDYFHERVDVRGYTCSEGIRAARSVSLVSRSLGLYGVADIVEFQASREGLPLLPVEYKVGRPKTEDWDRVQLAAQAMCLEEMYGASIDHGALYYGQTRHRETIRITLELRERVTQLSKRAHELSVSGRTPRAVQLARCKRCSLIDVCFPSALGKDVGEYWTSLGEPLEVLN